MVNEFNKPPKAALENENVRERMEISNRNMQRMRQEHEELVREMEDLRQTAAELTRRNHPQTSATKQPTSLPTPTSNQLSDIEEPSGTEAASNNQDNSDMNSETIEGSSKKASIDSEVENNARIENPESHGTSPSSDNDDESMQYLREKIAQISAMKTQFQRVQQTINTTNLIEAHLASNSLEENTANAGNVQKTNISDNNNNNNTTTNNNLNNFPKAEGGANVMSTSSMNVDQSLDNLNLKDLTMGEGGTNREENMELLMNLLNLFDEFKNDLREQADGLRAERDRLRALKESILRRRNQS